MKTNAEDENDRIFEAEAESEPRDGWSGRLGPVSRVSARDAVSEQILALIKSGNLKPGDRLPSELELIEMTGVSRSSVREAIRSLMTMQLVEIRPGKGTYIREVSAAGVTDAQVLLMLSDRKALDDLIEVRRVLEPVIARLAAERATPDDLRALEQAIDEIHAAPDHAAWRAPHLAFHQSLAEATHNTILTKIWGLVAMFLKDSPLVILQSSRPHVHEALYEAIVAHDAEGAAAAMQAHIDEMVGATAER